MYINVHNDEKRQTLEQAMKQVSFTEFRRNAATYFDVVEHGEIVRIHRHGKPIAEIVPVETAKKTVAWKRPGPLIESGGAFLGREILRERKSGRK
jgi:prevent-host-death family protein